MNATSPNPYAPPADHEPFIPDTSASEPYRPSNAIATALQGALGLVTLSNAALFVMTWTQIDLLERMRDGGAWTMPEVEASDMRIGLVAGVYLTSFVVSAILWCIWQARTSKNARALGAQNMEFGPNAWGWFFCPIINLLRPANVVRELWIESDHQSADSSPPGVFTVWWASWIITNIVAQVSQRMAKASPDDLDALISTSWLEQLSNVFGIAAGVAAILVIAAIQARAVAGRARRQAQPS